MPFSSLQKVKRQPCHLFLVGFVHPVYFDKRSLQMVGIWEFIAPTRFVLHVEYKFENELRSGRRREQKFRADEDPIEIGSARNVWRYLRLTMTLGNHKLDNSPFMQNKR